MKFSEQWLREWVNPALTTEELVHQITMAGLEVDGVEPAAASLSQVVVGEILETDAHPNADKLKVCRVDSGTETHQVVCGAPNARPGLKAPFAMVGAKLDDFKIKKAKLRGVESFGMLCSERELGLSDQHEGLMELAETAPVGTDINTYLGLDDSIVEVDLTPNRSDCLGIIGLARETGLMNNLDVCMPVIAPIEPVIDDTISVELSAGTACPRFVGRVIKNVDLSAPSPLWLVEKLRRSGIRSIDPVVDVTNYVMLELNQPMHAYDLNALKGTIRVRSSRGGESLDLLNGQTVELLDETLLITDDSGPIGMAGVMGGSGTAVKPETRNIFLEAAFFAPVAIAGRARAYAMHTDAGHRFERGVDFMGQSRAMERATALLLSISGGEPGPLVDTVKEDDLPVLPKVTLRAARIERVLGMAISEADVENILKRLDFEFAVDPAESEKVWQVSSPSHRFDINIEADLIEEISRIIGYDNLPVTRPTAELMMLESTEQAVSVKSLKAQLASRGYSEAITYSFVDDQKQRLLTPQVAPVALKNPLSSEMNVMRTTLCGGLLNALVHNQNRQQQDVRLFETGLVFEQNSSGSLNFDNIEQKNRLALVLSGRRLPEGWANAQASADFFDLKGDLEFLLGAQGLSFEACDLPGMQVGQCATVLMGVEVLGYLGLVNRGVAQAFDLRNPVLIAEIDLAMAMRRSVPRVVEVSKFPEVRRDLAMLVDRAVSASEIQNVIYAHAGSALLHLKLFDVYTGKGVETIQKSIGIGLTFQHPSRTLTDDEISTAMAEVVAALETKLKAQLRN